MNSFLQQKKKTQANRNGEKNLRLDDTTFCIQIIFFITDVTVFSIDKTNKAIKWGLSKSGT